MKIAKIKRESFYGEYQLTAVMEDGTEEFLFGYSPSDYAIRDQDLVGKTAGEASDLLRRKNYEYFEHHLW